MVNESPKPVDIKKALKKLPPHKPDTIPAGKRRLLPRVLLFCEAYATNIYGTFGNGRKSYQVAYQGVSDEVAGVCASKLLAIAKVRDHLKTLWVRSHLTDEEVDAITADLVRQDRDLGVKIRAIDQNNKVKGRLNQKLHITGTMETVQDISDAMKELLGGKKEKPIKK